MARILLKKILCNIFRLFIFLSRSCETDDYQIFIGKKILIISCEGIGNAILSIPLIYALSQNTKNCQVDILTSSASHKTILESTRCGHNVIVSQKKLFKRVKQYLELRKIQYDFCFMAFPTLSLTKELIPFFIGSKYNFSHNYQILHEFFFPIKNLYQSLVEIDPALHDIEQNLNLIRNISLPIADFNRYPKFYINESAHRFALDYFRSKNISDDNFIVAIHPGSSKGALYKRWPIQNFALLAKVILSRLHAVIIFILGPEEIELKKFLDIDNIQVLETHRIDNVAAVLKKCNLFICNDSGIMHLAALINLPIITIWGGTDEKRIGACAANVTNIINDIHCRPCIRLIPNYPCIDKEYKCINGISAEDVFKSIIKIYEENYHAAF